ncbi:Alpha/Beta hydrolase protein [Podospora didyma]|uniref:Carboxylic ester hydrolase n=1 Tax=Podospora didyma TaxID=330526 RepID=A0AAE0NPR5_9PEZI|nr:Alpha/Beta hydrolase protein [Podospora didyma]
MRAAIPQAALAAIFLSSGAYSAPAKQCTPVLPVVDLGYEQHRALSYNDTTDAYKFQNIRFAQAPLGNLRFRAPVPPKINRTAIQIGAETRTCPQGVPDWQAKAYVAISKYSTPNYPFNLEAWVKDLLNGQPLRAPWNAVSSEDCLFLDVHVPKKVFKAKSQGRNPGAPVLVWIHGGGYVLGSKSGTPALVYEPSGLLNHAALQDKEDSMIFVALNYRLGALGFLSGPEVAADGDLNAGILDQRLALGWVQKYIHLFGGDKDRVTVMGESAGGGSIILHMTAYAGTKNPASTLFKAAIPQSPAIQPALYAPPNQLVDFLSHLNVSTLAEARALPEAAMIAGNAASVGDAFPTNYVYGPVIDGDYIPREAKLMLRDGQFDQSINVLSAHNNFEGAFFFDPLVDTEDKFAPWIDQSITGLSSRAVNQLVTEIYPPTTPAEASPSLGYVDIFSRQMSLWSDALINCNVDLLGETTKGNMYSYVFSVPPGFHIQDTKYSFNDPTTPATYPAVQDLMQRAIVSFVQTGVPVLEDGAVFPKWGNERAVLNITATGAYESASGINATRCEFWRDV